MEKVGKIARRTARGMRCDELRARLPRPVDDSYGPFLPDHVRIKSQPQPDAAGTFLLKVLSQGAVRVAPPAGDQLGLHLQLRREVLDAEAGTDTVCRPHAGGFQGFGAFEAEICAIGHMRVVHDASGASIDRLQGAGELAPEDLVGIEKGGSHVAGRHVLLSRKSDAEMIGKGRGRD